MLKILFFLVMFSLPVFRLSAASILVLDEAAAVEYALSHGREVLSAGEDVEEASSRLSAAKAGFLPRVEASGHYSMYRNHPTMPFEENTGYRFEISQHIFTGGRLTGERGAASYGLEASMLALSEAENRLRFRTREAFYGAILAREVARINRESLALAEEMLETVRRRHDMGEASRYELLRQGVEVENIRSDALKAENDAEIAVNLLKSVIGAPDGYRVVPDGVLEFSEVRADPEEAAAYALENRPALKEAAALLESAGFRVRAARSGIYPSVFLSVSRIANREEPFADERSRYESYWEGRLGVSVPVFDGGLARARAREAEAGKNRAEILLEQLESDVLVEVENALLELESSAERVGFQEKNIAAAGEAYGIIRRRYAAGEAPHLEVMDSRLALSSAELNYSLSLRDHILAGARLELAAGGEFREKLYPTEEKDE